MCVCVFIMMIITLVIFLPSQYTNHLSGYSSGYSRGTLCGTEVIKRHYVNVSVVIKFSQTTSVFTLIIISSP